MLFNGRAVQLTDKEVELPKGYEDELIRRQPQFFRASIDYVYRMGGDVYRMILDRAPIGGRRRYISIDSRVHMLMPGFWPCIPGWHCDDFHRPTSMKNGQPDLVAIAAHPNLVAMHHALILGSSPVTSLTQFLDEGVDIPVHVLQSEHVYAGCDRILTEQHPWTVKIAQPGKFISFDSLVFHRGMKSTSTGWRLFVRISESDHHRPKNEMRMQTQVYLDDPSVGW